MAQVASFERMPEGGKAILVIGNEGKGLRKLVRAQCTHTVAIPKSPACDPEIDSLNLSVAAGVLMNKLLNG